MLETSAVNRELAVMTGFLFAVSLLFGAIAWMALNYIESDLDRFAQWASSKD